MSWLMELREKVDWMQQQLVSFHPSVPWLLGIFLSFLVVRLVYLYVTAPPRRKPLQFFSRHSSSFEAYRLKRFPPAYPNGWWKLCDVSDLNHGRIQTVQCCGQELIVFRGADGRIGVLDAFCPHIGAHLGVGGRVVENAIKCPFHGWEFNAEGECINIPYCTSEKLPANARTRSWAHRVWMDMVFVWFDAEGREPAYELAPLPEIENKWEVRTMVQSYFDMHITEMAENSADYFHFNYLHARLPLPILGSFFTVRHDTKLYFPEGENSKHISYFDNWAMIWFLNRFPLTFTRQKTTVTFEGPSVVHFAIDTPLGSLRLIKTLLPVAPFKLYNEDRWYVEKRVPRWLSMIVARIAKGALEQDRLVWQNKRYNPKPNLVSGDGPFPAHRRWFKQFYSEHSPQVGKDPLEW